MSMEEEFSQVSSIAMSLAPTGSLKSLQSGLQSDLGSLNSQNSVQLQVPEFSQNSINGSLKSLQSQLSDCQSFKNSSSSQKTNSLDGNLSQNFENSLPQSQFSINSNQLGSGEYDPLTTVKEENELTQSIKQSFVRSVNASLEQNIELSGKMMEEIGSVENSLKSIEIEENGSLGSGVRSMN